MKRSSDIILTGGGGSFHQELKHFECNYMFCVCFGICFCRIANIDNCTFIAPK